MIIKTALFSQVRCTSCSSSVLQRFISCATTSGEAATGTPGLLAKRWTSPQRNLATSSLLPLEAGDLAQKVEPAEHEYFREEPNSSNQEKPVESTTSIPWYLQVRKPQHVQSPMSDRQRLPDLPSDPPPLLQPMLEHISINLGLDDLSLLDLRRLDPPPALGANLLMVVSTARSEKHLHVSADRFCRWLRTEHKLSPYPDGLLGRGELKLKMRRKARRARIMSRVGSSEQGSADDGLRTGWVCVNIGTVEDGTTAVDDKSTIDGYVGFGTRSRGTKVVIQMLTQEKREELDLERLWSQALARQERRQKRISRDVVESDEVTSQELRQSIPSNSEP